MMVPGFQSFGQGKVPVDDTVLWLGPDQSPLPFRDFEEIEVFLASAQVVSVREIPRGVTKPQRLLLEKDGIQMNAIFRTVNDFKARWDSPKGLQFNFHDFCVYECAAYRLSRLLGMLHVPPVVQRKLTKEDFQNPKHFSKLKSREGTLQAWVEDAFTDRERVEEKIRPPDPLRFGNQRHLLNLFDNLIFNLDRNQGNILIGPDWKIWFIDQTRAFRPYDELKEPEKVKKCDRRVWEKLKTLEDAEIERQLGEFLPDSILRTLLIRRTKIVELLQKSIETDGEQYVLFDLDR
jgi:hypothetical protein